MSRSPRAHREAAPENVDACQGKRRANTLMRMSFRSPLRPARASQDDRGQQGKQGPREAMRSDSDVKRDVEDELRWEPEVDASDIAVSVKDGVVTLTGFVRSFHEKYVAEVAAKRVSGVAGVANDLEVRLPDMDQRPDPEIAREAIAAIRSQLQESAD